MPMSEPEPRRGRGRPRIPGAEERILDAALEEYGQHGWSGFTMDGVARRAGVGKSTVYLRWQDKDSLLTEAVATRSGTLAAVDTGTLRGDLEQLARNLFHHYLDPGGWASLRIIIDGAGATRSLGHFVETVANVQVDFMAQIVARACERGELTGDFAGNAISELLYGAVVMQILGIRLQSRTLTDDDIDERSERVVTLVLDGVVRWAGPGDARPAG
jgi:AcrR family transcriptional regulator